MFNQESYISPDLHRTRDLVMKLGRNSTSYQVINPGFERWFAKLSYGMVGYVERRNVRVVAGEPICSVEDIGNVAQEFEDDAQRNHQGVCYFCASEMFTKRHLEKKGYATILIGAQPVWHPEALSGIMNSHPSLRAQLNRATNKEVTISEWPTAIANDNEDLRRCLYEWIESRRLPPLHFLIEPETLSRLYDRRIFVAQRETIPIGFVVASPIPQKNGWLIEQIIRSHGAPNGVAELMLHHTFLALAQDGYDYVTLGLSPLSHRAAIDSGNPGWISFLFNWVRLHGNRFYNFDGLDFFKAKFQPERWEPIYAISKEHRFSLRTLYAISSAFSDSPIATLSKELRKAMRQELRWKFRKPYDV